LVYAEGESVNKVLNIINLPRLSIGISFFFLILAVIAGGCSDAEEVIPVGSNNGPPNGSDTLYYSDVKKILDLECATAGCHSGPYPSIGLGLETYEQVLLGSDNGPVVVPGNANSSFLYRTMTGDSPPMMPTTEWLPQPQIDSVGKWIDDGLLE
jgi:hypothetical protein